ncbi:acylneuraminate cytidylyltransferase [Bacteroides intestinalis CAG:564]|nr:acylneuraminate cytidylyltransferase [Bacteroides intestinalis CAG:564]
MILLQATNPLRPKELLSEAIRIMEKGGYDSLMTVNKSLKKLGKIIDNQFVPWNYRFGMRSQDMDPLYYENGLLYITSKEQIFKGNIIGDKMYPMVVEHIFGEVDIDTMEDMSYAEYVFFNAKTNE